jgi:hypothetical protein
MPSFERSFLAAEGRALRFLVEDLCFRAVERTLTPEDTMWTCGTVTYRCDGTNGSGTPKDWTVTLAYAPARLELSLEISNESGASFTVEELHALVTTEPFPKGTHSLLDSIHDEDAHFCEFERLARVLRSSGVRFFAGDRSLWQELQTAREREQLAEEDRRAIARSENAFQAKDWRQVVAALESRESRLSKAAMARLSYARTRLKSAA